MSSTENSFPLAPKVINISMTERCNARCKICATSSNPDLYNTDINEEKGLDLIKQASEIKDLLGVCFTGGEPFLKMDTMKEFIYSSFKSGLFASAVTNCFWAKNVSIAEEILNELKSIGLRRITVSADSYHQAHVPIEMVDNAIWAAKTVGISCNLNCVVGPGADPLKTVLSKLKHREYLDKTLEFSLLPVGRGAGLELEKGTTLPTGRCRLIISTLSVKYNGDTYACCGAGGFTHPLKLGNAFETPLKKLVESAVGNPLIIALAIYGPKYLYSANSKPVDDRFINQCHMCHSLLEDAEAASDISNFIAKQENKIMAQYQLYTSLKVGELWHEYS